MENMNISTAYKSTILDHLFPNWWSIIINIIDIALVACCCIDQGHRRDQDHDFGSWSYYLFLVQFFSQFLRAHDYFMADQVITYGVIALVVIFSLKFDWLVT